MSIAFEITQDILPQKNMDIDKANLLAGRPLLRFYSWKPAGISLGISEKAEDLLDTAACNDQGIEVVSRLTGGASVLHRDDFTYSIVLPREMWPDRSLHAIYDTISLALQKGLQYLGVEVERAEAGPWKMPETHVCFQGPSKNEILVAGRKIVGSAQCHKRKAIVQHGSLMIKNHTAQLCKLLKIHDEQLIEEVVSKTISLHEVLGDATPSFESIAQAMHHSFAEVFATKGLCLDCF